MDVRAASPEPLQLKFTAVDGKLVDLNNLKGKVVLLDFWATWCRPCRAEVPDLVSTYQKYHDQGFEIVGVSLDKRQDTLMEFIGKNHMTWPEYFDGKGLGQRSEQPVRH